MLQPYSIQLSPMPRFSGRGNNKKRAVIRVNAIFFSSEKKHNYLDCNNDAIQNYPLIWRMVARRLFPKLSIPCPRVKHRVINNPRLSLTEAMISLCASHSKSWEYAFTVLRQYRGVKIFFFSKIHFLFLFWC